MSVPAYHMRKNKAADRFALIEAIKFLPRIGYDYREYTYFSLGGPYLDDIRLMYEFYPEISMISIEEDPNVCRRQDFHRPCGTVTLVNSDMRTFIAEYESEDKKSIFWLDYTGLEYTNFEDFEMLLTRVAEGSMVKITLRADPRRYKKRWQQNIFRRDFAKLLPEPMGDIPWQFENFARLVQDMLRMASYRALSAASPLMFHPISSFYYSDGTYILTLTGIVWPRNKTETLLTAYRDWPFSNLNWDIPRLIDIPDLSTQERLHIQRHLPCEMTDGAFLRRALGYLIKKDAEQTDAALQQYADFHRYFPYFLRGVP